MKLTVDDNDRRMISKDDFNFIGPSSDPGDIDYEELARFRRQSLRRQNQIKSTITRAPTGIYIGGGAKMIHFIGCIGFIQIARYF